MTLSRSTCPGIVSRTGGWLAVGAFLLTLSAAPVLAQHRARLSHDLADRLQEGSQTIDVIVDGSQMVEELARRYNVPVRKRMRSGGVLRVTAGQLEALEADGLVDHLSGDTPIRSMVEDVTAETVGADQLWHGAGRLPKLSGKRVGVAVVDSGIDANHPALRGQVVAAVDFTGNGSAADRFGHGTHVAGIIAARAGGSYDTADIQGMAYGASLINLRVLGDDGSGYVSNVIAAIDWAIDHQAQFNIRVINLSLGAPVLQPYRDDPLCAAVERAVAAGIVVVAAAGNRGVTDAGQTVFGGVMSPGNSPFAITVGAIDAHGTPERGDDTLAVYSSRGPTAYDLVGKPDLVAPGSHIVSTEAAGSYLQRLLPDRHVAGGAADGYLQLSGTSMSAAVVSGAAALLIDERAALTPRDVKGLLRASSQFMPEAGLMSAGAGSVNLVAAASLAGRGSRRSAQIDDTVYLQGSRPAAANRTFRQRNSTLSGSWGDSIIWGSWGDSIIWGSWGDSIIWGSWGDSIIWGSWGDSIIWGSWGDSIIWGSWGDSIIWGSFAQDSIIWGSAAEDSIIWGSWNDDSIIWGS